VAHDRDLGGDEGRDMLGPHAAALELDRLGAAALAARITAAIAIPTIGIGAGADCSGQVLVWHDLLGMSGEFQPRFVKRYAELGEAAAGAIAAYADEVRRRVFPAREHTYGEGRGSGQAAGGQE
jgi:3-methyl-2-oxobutanoate hydroxymethyltransferase